jgi:hypothetical protein
MREADVVQVQGRPDKGKMRKCLRKAADLPADPRILFLRHEADVVSKRKQPRTCRNKRLTVHREKGKNDGYRIQEGLKETPLLYLREA